MLKLTLSAILAAGFAIPIADEPPTLAVERGCRETARLDPLKQITTEACLAQERSAHDELTKAWSTFSSLDRAHCESLTAIGGMPSYVELLICLQMSRDARKMRQEGESTTSGQGSGQGSGQDGAQDTPPDISRSQK
jgi:hypothetical protein